MIEVGEMCNFDIEFSIFWNILVMIGDVKVWLEIGFDIVLVLDFIDKDIFIVCFELMMDGIFSVLEV